MVPSAQRVSWALGLRAEQKEERRPRASRGDSQRRALLLRTPPSARSLRPRPAPMRALPRSVQRPVATSSGTMEMSPPTRDWGSVPVSL